MRKMIPWLDRMVCTFSLLCLPLLALAANAPPNAAAKTGIVEGYGRVPLSFEANQGQTDPRVKFLARGPGYSLFLTPTEAVLALQKAKPNRQDQSPCPLWRVTDRVKAHGVEKPDQTSVLRMRLVGANPKPKATGIEALPAKVNYFRGKDPKQWRANIPTYAKVKYERVYPGIDLVYYGRQRQLEYDFIVAPGADPGAIRLAFNGAERFAIDAQGDLVLKTGGSNVRLPKPRAYQDINGRQHAIEGRYLLLPAKTHGEALVGFQVAGYDEAKPLIIDPVLVYSTYLGGDNFDAGFDVAVDSAGNAYVTGFANSTDFPTANPIQGFLASFRDAFVAKLNAAGSSLVYSTYLGGSVDETGSGIAVDTGGNAYVMGFTSSSDFPTVHPFQRFLAGGSGDAFMAKLSASGSALVYSTYLGGSGYELAAGIAVDSAGNAYVTGLTYSTDFPTARPLQGFMAGFRDAFVAKLKADGSALVYSTYVGGNGDDFGGGTEGGGIAVDTAGNAYVTGFTSSTDFPTTHPLQGFLAGGGDGFVAKLNPAGSAFVYSTYLGGNGDDAESDIAVDAGGNAYITGITNSTDFPITAGSFDTTYNGGVNDVFVVKVNAAGSGLVYSTYLGGSGGDFDPRIVVDGASNARLMGWTGSIDFPTTAGSFDTSYNGNGDAFVATLDANGSALAYSTYLGGNNSDFGHSIAVDSAGSAYVTGWTASTDFPTTAGAFDTSYNSGNDAFVVKIGDVAPPPPPPPPPVPVVLVHGFLGSPSSFGVMKTLLERAGLRVDTFDYSDLTGPGSPVTIEELAGLLGAHVRQVLEDTGATHVNVVAHSMGGLITRAWMSGMLANLQIPYEGQIRKLILVGTPNYGAAVALLNSACAVAFGNLGCSRTQARELRFGSKFILTLHGRWAKFQRNSQHRIPEENILLIAGTRGSAETGIECRDLTSPEGCDDGIVDISSAVLPDSVEERVRYVPYRHADLPIVRPLGGITLVGVNDNQHATYRLVIEFLKNGTVLGQCCGQNTVDYNPPHLRGVSRLREGLLIMRLVDSRAGRPIRVTPRIVRPIRQDFLQQGNKDGGAVSAYGMKAPKKYDVTVAAKGYTRRAFRNIKVNLARPTVSKPLKLIPR